MLPDYQLIQSIKSGCTADFKAALVRGGQLDAYDIDGRTTLEIAQAYGRCDWVRELVQLGADPNRAIGKGADTLLHRSARKGDVGFSVALLQNGADPNAAGRAGQRPIHLTVRGGFQYLATQFIQLGADPNIENDQGDIALHIAARSGRTDLIRTLIAGGADPERTNRVGYTPLHVAAAAGHIKALQALVELVRQCDTATVRPALLRGVLRAAEIDN